MSEMPAGRLGLDTPLGRSLGEVARECCGLRIGLALGDGSAKGFANFGVLRALEEAGVPCDAIAGTSIGAAVAGLYPAGFPLDTAQAHLARVGSSTFRPMLSRSSFMSHSGVADIMREPGGRCSRPEPMSWWPFACLPVAVQRATRWWRQPSLLARRHRSCRRCCARVSYCKRGSCRNRRGSRSSWTCGFRPMLALDSATSARVSDS